MELGRDATYGDTHYTCEHDAHVLIDPMSAPAVLACADLRVGFILGNVMHYQVAGDQAALWWATVDREVHKRAKEFDE